MYIATLQGNYSEALPAQARMQIYNMYVHVIFNSDFVLNTH